MLQLSGNYRIQLLIGSIFFIFLFCAAYWNSLKPLFILWLGLDEVSDMSGLLALACSTYLIYLKRHQLMSVVPRPILIAGVTLTVFSLLWFAAEVSGIQSIQFALLPPILMAAVAFWYGYQGLKLVFIPLVILLFVLPIWSPLVPLLRDITTFAAHTGLDIIGRPVFVQGYFLHLPGGSFLIDASCSGLRFLLVTLLLSFVCHDLFRHSVGQTAILISSGIVLALIANWIRVLIIILIGDYTLMESPIVQDHANLGWVVYGLVVLVPFFFINGYIEKSEGPLQVTQVEMSNSPKKVSPGHFLLVCVFLLLGPLLSAVAAKLPSSTVELVLPDTINSWSRVDTAVSMNREFWEPQYAGFSEKLIARFESSAGIVDVYVVYYANQKQGSELINVNNTLTDQERWVALDRTLSRRSVEIGQEEMHEVNSIVISDASGLDQAVWYWYNVGGSNTASEITAKLYQFSSLASGRRDAALVALSADCDVECKESEVILGRFVRENYEVLNTIF